MRIKGKRNKHLVVQIPGVLIAAVEIKPELEIEAEVKKWYKEHFKPTRPYENYSGFYLKKKTILDLANRFYELGRQYK